MESIKKNTEKLKDSILIQIDREDKLCKILDSAVDEEFINKLAEEWIGIMKKSLAKYQ